MKFHKKLAASVLAGLILTAPVANACTLVFWNNNDVAKVAARTMDLYTSDMPQMVVFPQGITRNGLAGVNSAQWTSKYGSVVITAFHMQNAVSEGMNSAGLGVHLLYLDKTQYQKRDLSIPGVANIMWVQYILDNCKTVDQAIALSKKIQIISMKANGREWPVHLAVQDATGDSAIMEFINGKLVIHHGAQYNVMTNEPAYDVQLANLKKYKLFGGALPMPGDVDPLSRFVRASSYLKTLPAPDNYIAAIAGVASVIRTTMVPFGSHDTSGNEAEDSWPTRWMSIQDMTDKIYYFSSTTAPNVIWLDFSKLNFAAGAPVMMVDPANLQLSGEISANLVPYQTANS